MDVTKVWEVRKDPKLSNMGQKEDLTMGVTSAVLAPSRVQPQQGEEGMIQSQTQVHVKSSSVKNSSGEPLGIKEHTRLPSSPDASPNLQTSKPAKDTVSAPSLPVSEPDHGKSPPLRTYMKKKKRKKVVKRVILIPEVDSDDNREGIADSSDSSAPPDYTSDDVSDTGGEYTKVMSKKERSFERKNQGTRPKSSSREG